jgi:hypothetical protein
MFHPVSAFAVESVMGPVNFAGVLFEVNLKDSIIKMYSDQVQEIRAQRSGLHLAKNMPNLGDLHMNPGRG